MKRILISVVLIFQISLVHAMDHQKLSAIVIHDPWIRTAPPNAPMLGLFMKIRNNTNQDKD